MRVQDQMDGLLGKCLGQEQRMAAAYVPLFSNMLMNAYFSPIQRKLNAAREFIQDHPYNPGVLDRWLKSKNGQENTGDPA